MARSHGRVATGVVRSVVSKTKRQKTNCAELMLFENAVHILKAVPHTLLQGGVRMGDQNLRAVVFPPARSSSRSSLSPTA